MVRNTSSARITYIDSRYDCLSFHLNNSIHSKTNCFPQEIFKHSKSFISYLAFPPTSTYLPSKHVSLFNHPWVDPCAPTNNVFANTLGSYRISHFMQLHFTVKPSIFDFPKTMCVDHVCWFSKDHVCWINELTFFFRTELHKLARLI